MRTRRCARTAGAATSCAVVALSIGLVLVSGCARYRASSPGLVALDSLTPDSSIAVTGDPPFTIFALGDWGTGDDHQRAVASALAAEVAELPSWARPPVVLELGDNVYEHGLPRGRPWNAPETRALLDRTFGDVYGDVRFHGEPVRFGVVAGNHDHGRMFPVREKDDWGDVVPHETLAESLWVNYRHYPLPHARVGLSDSNDRAEFEALSDPSVRLTDLMLPERIDVGDDRVCVIALDTQLILNLYEQAGPPRREVPAAERHWAELARLLDERWRGDPGSRAAWTIVIGHHPVRTYGWHGGLSGPKQWLWSGARDSLPWYLRVLPPVLWAVVTNVYDVCVDDLQDLDHGANRAFRERLHRILVEHDVDVYASGHDHNLQLVHLGTPDDRVEDGRLLQIVSGSASKLEPIARGGDELLFSSSSFGYVRLDVSRAALGITVVGVDTGTFRDRGSVHGTTLASYRLQRTPS